MYERLTKSNNSVHGGSAYFKVAQKHRALCGTSSLVDCVLRLSDSRACLKNKNCTKKENVQSINRCDKYNLTDKNCILCVL